MKYFSIFKKTLSVIAIIIIATVFTACGNESFNPDEKMDVILQDVKFASEMTDVSDSAEFYFYDLPDGVEIEMYQTESSYADCLCLFTAKDSSDIEAVRASVDAYLESALEQANNYQAGEAFKIENAVIYENDIYLLMCVTEDTDTVNSILG